MHEIHFTSDQNVFLYRPHKSLISMYKVIAEMFN